MQTNYYERKTMDIDLSKVTEDQTKRVGANIVVYSVVVKKKIPISELTAEKKNLLLDLKQEEPSAEELIERGRQHHPYYRYTKEEIQKRIDEIDLVLNN